MEAAAEYLPTVLIVDDTPDNITLISAMLRGEYRTKVATNGAKALEIAATAAHPDLILLDVMMPGMDGYDVCGRLKADPRTADIPVIFLTAKTDVADEQRGLALGAVDYIFKPVSPPIVTARVRTHIQLKRARDFLRDKSDYLEQEVARRTREVLVIQDVAMVAMGSLAETRDNETGNHIRRTQRYVMTLASALRRHPRFADFLTPETAELLGKSAPLHDIGKVGIPDSILLKPASLTAEEFAVMKTHTTIGHAAIAAAERGMGTSNSFLRHAREMAVSHHERWDGTGYPRGLAGDAIPTSGRLMAVADVYDALISARVYKPAMPHEQALQIIASGAGAAFDPDVASAFLGAVDEFTRIARELADDRPA
jgi:putative two-component system response regulator